MAKGSRGGKGSGNGLASRIAALEKYAEKVKSEITLEERMFDATHQAMFTLK